MKKILNFFKENDAMVYFLFCGIIVIISLSIIFRDKILTTFLTSIFAYVFKATYDRYLDRKQKNFEIKQKYYHEFLKAFSEKMAYVNSNVELDVEVNKNFSIETGRLVIYASSEVVDFVEKIKKDPTKHTVAELFNLIREDLELSNVNKEYSLILYNLDNKTSEK